MSYSRRRGLGGRGADSGRKESDGPGPAPRPRSPRGGASGGAPSSGDPRRRRLYISVAVVGAALVVGYATAALWLFPPAASAEDTSVVEVPDVVGLEGAEARERVLSAGLEFTVRAGMTHREAPEGTVLAQSPLAGQFSRPGAPVAVTLSRGPETHTLPDVSGLSERQATIVLERLGYAVEVETREDPVPAGRAIETRPPAGTDLVSPGEVRLVVSEGAPIVVVPDMLGMHIDDAVDILSESSLELGSISFDPEAADAPGRIVGQYPPVGYSLRAGDAVELRVAGESDDLNREPETDGDEGSSLL